MSEADHVEQDRKSLEALVVNNPDLERLKALLGRFNIFEAVGLVRQEIRHSAFLTFLLDPQQNHGLEDAFVKRLLQKAIMSAPDVFAPITPTEANLWNLEQLEVRREWWHIDILLLDKRNRLAVIVENKIDTGEHFGQLTRYYETVKKHYPAYKPVGVYLTPSGNRPSHKAYATLGYSTVVGILDDLASDQASVSNPDLQILLTHYTQMLRRHIVGDPEIAKLCRQIYRDHKEALDLVYRHRPNPKMDSRKLLDQLIDNTEGLVRKGGIKNDYILFRPQKWDNVAPLSGRQGGSGLLGFVFHNQPWGGSGELILFLEMSPGDESVRRKLFEMGQKNEKLFNDLIDPDTNDNPKLYRRTFLDSKFFEEATDEVREEEIRKHWMEFLEDDLARIDAALERESWIWESNEASESAKSSGSGSRFVWGDGDIRITQRPGEGDARDEK